MRLSTALGTAILLGAGVFAAVPAQAALADCGTNETCIWVNNNYSGTRADRFHGNSAIVNVPDNVNDRMDSWANRSGTYGSCGYGGLNGDGDRQQWNATSNDNDVAPWNADEVSSWRTRFGC